LFPERRFTREPRRLPYDVQPNGDRAMVQESKEKELELALQKTSSTLQRQKLLRLLWQLRRNRQPQRDAPKMNR